MKAGLAVAALNDAWLRRGRPAGVIAHSDRGSQFGSRKYIRACEQFQIRRSMGQAHTCADNAAMESFFALLQNNVLNQRKHWQTRAELRLKIVAWIEGTYNRRRRQRRLGKLTPVQYETTHQNTNQYTLTQ
jgi:transposase InsO family protein